MVKVRQIILDEDAHAWLTALVSLSKKERKETLGQFCSQCGIEYRHLYPVIEGKSAISAEVLAALRGRASALGIEHTIKEKILANRLGISG